MAKKVEGVSVVVSPIKGDVSQVVNLALTKEDLVDIMVNEATKNMEERAKELTALKERLQKQLGVVKQEIVQKEILRVLNAAAVGKHEVTKVTLSLGYKTKRHETAKEAEEYYDTSGTPWSTEEVVKPLGHARLRYRVENKCTQMEIVKDHIMASEYPEIVQAYKLYDEYLALHNECQKLNEMYTVGLKGLRNKLKQQLIENVLAATKEGAEITSYLKARVAGDMVALLKGDK